MASFGIVSHVAMAISGFGLLPQDKRIINPIKIKAKILFFIV